MAQNDGPGAMMGGETARTAIRAGRAFVPSALASSVAGMARLADRWAPEGIGALRQPALRSLGFIDRLLAPRRASLAPRQRDAGSGVGAWMLPVPWYGEAEAAPQLTARRSIRAQAARDADVAMGRRPVPTPPPAPPAGLP